MLKLKHTHHLNLPSFLSRPTSTREMALSPVTDDSDELTQDIRNDIEKQDDKWELDERPNSDELNRFWSQVEEEVQKDPEWSFVDDEL